MGAPFDDAEATNDVGSAYVFARSGSNWIQQTKLTAGEEDSKKSNADWIVTTEKDIMRLKKLDVPGNLVALAIEFRVDKEFYEEVFWQ